MSANTVIQKIQEKAQAQCDEILENGKQKADAAREAILKDGKAKADGILEKAREDAAMLLRAGAQQASLDSKIQQHANFLFRRIVIRENHLHQTRHGFLDSIPIPG